MQQAQETASNVELQTKILEYKNGTASYQDVVNLLKTKQTGAIPGSQRELDLKEVGLQLEQYETNKNREIKRADLKTKFAKGGISAEEQLQIEKEMLNNYKEGTPEYSEQLSNIAVATELASQEKKNAGLAQIQAQLSEGGLSVDEEIQLYKEGRDMSEKGTAEYAQFEQKINEAKVRKGQEEIDQKANEKYVEMLDRYKEGGVTNEESLAMTRELLNIYKPGTEEYTQAKETEAKLLGNIADEAASGAVKGARAEQDAKAAEFSALEAQLETLQNKFDIGAISLDEYLSVQQAITSSENDIAAEYPDLLEPKAQGELKVRFDQISELRNQVASGQAVVIKTPTKEGGIQTQRIVPLSELGAYAQDKMLYTFSDASGKQLKEDFMGQVVTIVDETGKERQVNIGKDGLEYLDSIGDDGTGKPALARTGEVLPFNGKKNTVTSKPAPMGGDTGGDVLGASTSNVTTKPGTVKVPGPTTNAKSRNQQINDSTNKNKTDSKTKSNEPPAKTAISNIKSTVNSITSALQKSGSGAGAYGGNKILSQGIKPGNIKGTIDIGVTEAISSTAKKLSSGVKNILGNLFGKR